MALRFDIKQLLASVLCLATACGLIAWCFRFHGTWAPGIDSLFSMVLLSPLIGLLIGGAVGALLDRFKTLVILGLVFGLAFWVLLAGILFV